MRLFLNLELITAHLQCRFPYESHSVTGRCSEERDPEVGAFGISVL